MSRVKISAVTFKCAPVGSFTDFADHVTRLVDEAASEDPDFIIFPELFTNELMHLVDAPDLGAKFMGIPKFTDDYLDLFAGLAKGKSVHIIGGSHFKAIGDKHFNTAHFFYPDGRVAEQPKVHLFPPEKTFTTPGEGFAVFETDKAKVAILTCYDMEFPEPARLATLAGAEILFSPSATLDPHGYWRVRHSAQARCIENQIYAVHCSLVGNWGLPGFEFQGMASIMTPCESGYPDKGIVAESPFNQEGVITGEVDTERLYEIRESGAAPTLKDRRFDLLEELYQLERKHGPEGRHSSTQLL